MKPIVEGGSVYDLGDSIMQRIIAGDASGRVIRLDKEMNSDGTERWHATVILRDLAVPTGIGMGREDELLLISESGRFSLLHHPLTPPQKDEGDALRTRAIDVSCAAMYLTRKQRSSRLCSGDSRRYHCPSEGLRTGTYSGPGHCFPC